MPLVPYYLGRPAHFWIAAMSRRESGQKVVCGRIPSSPEPADQAGVAADRQTPEMATGHYPAASRMLAPG